MVNTESLGRIGSADPVLVSDEAADASSPSGLRPVAHLNTDQRLARLGYRHERTPNAANTGKHFVYDPQGDLVGEMTAFEAIDFLATIETIQSQAA